MDWEEAAAISWGFDLPHEVQSLIVEDTVKFALVSVDEHLIEIGCLLYANDLANAAKLTDAYLWFYVEESDDLVHAKDKEFIVYDEGGLVLR